MCLLVNGPTAPQRSILLVQTALLFSFFLSCDREDDDAKKLMGAKKKRKDKRIKWFKVKKSSEPWLFQVLQDKNCSSVCSRLKESQRCCLAS